MGGRGASYAKASGGGGGGVKIISNDEIDMKGSEKQVKWAKDIRAEYIKEVKEYENSKELKAGSKSITGYPEHINNMINVASNDLSTFTKHYGEKIRNARNKVNDKLHQRMEKVSKMKAGPEKKQAYKELRNVKYRELKKETVPELHKIMNTNDASFWIRLKKSERFDNHAGSLFW